ncbi:MAG: ATPase domain-containing protein [Candidatus Thermoplasmatota archaeon]
MPRNRIKTYIKGFDEQLDGGIPEGQVVLVVGEPGTMKSSLAFNILYFNAKVEGIAGLYISLEQGRASLLDHMESLGMDMSLVEGTMHVLDLGLIRKNIKTLGEQTWMQVFKMYADNLKQTTDYKLLVLDSLPVLEVLADFKEPRVEVFQLFEWLRDLDVTSLIISEMSADAKAYAKHDEDFLSDGILHLKMERVDDVNIQRRLRCVKMRSTNHSPNYFTLLFSDGMFQVTRAIGERTT